MANRVQKPATILKSSSPITSFSQAQAKVTLAVVVSVVSRGPQA